MLTVNAAKEWIIKGTYIFIGLKLGEFILNLILANVPAVKIGG